MGKLNKAFEKILSDTTQLQNEIKTLGQIRKTKGYKTAETVKDIERAARIMKASVNSFNAVLKNLITGDLNETIQLFDFHSNNLKNSHKQMDVDGINHNLDALEKLGEHLPGVLKHLRTFNNKFDVEECQIDDLSDEEISQALDVIPDTPSKVTTLTPCTPTPTSTSADADDDTPCRRCPQHPDNIIDLQAIFIGKTSGEKRQYHRCHGRSEQEPWCGYNKKSSVKPLGDHNQKQVDTMSTQNSIQPAKETVTPPKSKSRNSTDANDNVKQYSDHGKGVGQSVTVSKSCDASDDDLTDQVENLSIVDDSDDEAHKALTNLSIHEEKKDSSIEINTSTSSNSSDSLPSPGLSGKSDKISPRTDIAEKYSKYKIKKKSSPLQEQKMSEKPTSNKSTDSDVNLPLAERIRLKSNESVKSSLSSCSSVSDALHSPRRGEEVIDLVSTSDEENEQDDEMSRPPQRYQPPPQGQGQTNKTETVKNGSESIIKDALKQVQGQQVPVQPNLQFVPPRPSGLTTAAQFDLQLDMERRSDLQRQLEKLKTVVATAKMSALPDKGEKLRKQVDDIERALRIVNKIIANTMEKSGTASTQQDNQSSTSVPQQPINNQPQYKTVKIVQSDGKTMTVKVPVTSAGTQPIIQNQQGINVVGAVTQPVSHFQTHNPQGLKQTSILSHTQTIPPHIMQQLYAANPQAMQLYGGRMTNQRLREVTSITAEAIEKLHKQLETCPDDTCQLEDPEGVKVPLMTHQRQALAWLVWRERQQPAGGILADDMGLGKTLTMISLILKRKQLKENGTDEDKQTWLSRDKQLEKLSKSLVRSRASLVICPASLIHQWKSEIERRVRGSRLKVLLYHGQDRESDILKLADNDVVLTTYNLVAKEVGAADINAENPAKDEDPDEMAKQEELSAVKHKSDSKLLRIAWERIILDEAHNIKNHKSLTAVSVCRLRAGFRWALTGTPIQNKLLDIYSLLRFLRCSPFDEYKLWKRQVERDSGHSRLNILVKCLLLRRTKSQVDKAGKPLVSLPSKTVKEYEINLSESERKIYEKIFAQSKSVMKDYLRRHEEKEMGITHKAEPSKVNPFQEKSLSKVGGQESQGQSGGLAINSSQRPGGQMILVMLLRLRQCCCHLSLMKDALEDEVAEDEGLELDIVEQMRGMGLEEESKDSSGPSLSKSSPIFEKTSLSTKVDAVMKKIKEIRESSERSKPQKSVIVSQWTKMLDIIAVHLEKMGIKYSVIQGNIPAKKRNEFVEDFNTNPKGSEVMLVSLRAGGVGLNLIGGNHLFLLDQHWNPALEDQACDRIYRVGQTRDVMIHRFLCKDTVEEKIVQLQDRKKRLADNVLTGSKATNSKLTLQDLRMIFGV